jgi:hypothetical protein
MRRWPWLLFWTAPLLAGCAPAPTAPPAPLDAAAPARTEVATFGLG